MDLREIGFDGANWIWLAQDRVQWLAFHEHSNEPLGSMQGREYLDHLSDNIPRTLLLQRIRKFKRLKGTYR
jgi:hypothetical protein